MTDLTDRLGHLEIAIRHDLDSLGSHLKEFNRLARDLRAAVREIAPDKLTPDKAAVLAVVEANWPAGKPEFRYKYQWFDDIQTLCSVQIPSVTVSHKTIQRALRLSKNKSDSPSLSLCGESLGGNISPLVHCSRCRGV